MTNLSTPHQRNEARPIAYGMRDPEQIENRRHYVYTAYRLGDPARRSLVLRFANDQRDPNELIIE